MPVPLKKPPQPAYSLNGANLTSTASPPPFVLAGFPKVPQPETATMLLTVSACRENHVFLKHVFRDTNWELRETRAYRDALMILCNDRMPVVICESCLPDGNWKDILSQVAALPDAPRLIVTSREPDESLWAEVLNMGGYDVLATPFEKDEVIRAVSWAWQSWKDEWSRVNQRWRKPRVLAQSA
jgi:DNA-binding NtrC family response regulator